jgi:glycerate kinase
VDETTAEGKAPAEVARRAAASGVPCVVFGGRVLAELPGTETVALSGHPARAAADLEELGRRLARRDPKLVRR